MLLSLKTNWFAIIALSLFSASAMCMEIHISIQNQKLYLIDENDTLKSYDVSTSKYGIGSETGSYKTPLGEHIIAEKYGDQAALGTVFKARKNTGKIAEIIAEPRHDGNDFVTTRILWLKGLEDGLNSGPGVDSYSRYIYIHGTHEEGLIGQPASHGCIRMRNADVIDLYEKVEVGTKVVIKRD